MTQYHAERYALATLLIASLFLAKAGTIPVKSTQNSPSADRITAEKPNVVVILADDLGYGDPGGYYGGKAKTPNLNRLAKEGMLFTDFHSNGAMCSPTRAAFLTGRYQQRLGIETALPTDWDDEGIGSDHNKNEITIAEYLAEAGYSSAIYGKWHLGKHASANPVHHGFDDFRGQTCGCGDYFSKLDRNGYKDWWHNDKLSFQEGYSTDVISDNSVRFIEKNKSQPFFLYVAYTAIHFPWQTAEDYDLEIRVEGGDFTSSNPGSKSKLGPHAKENVPSAVRSMIEKMDEGVGRILRTLKEQGLDKNTLIFFSSDNGGYLSYNQNAWPAVSSNGPLRGQKGQLYEGGHRVPAIARWPGKIRAGIVSNQTAMTFDLLPTVLDVLDISAPAKARPYSFDGQSLLPLLLENKPIDERPLFWRTGNQKAVRYGEWKLVLNKNAPPELYNLNMDIGETNNIASQYPEETGRLTSILDSWEEDVKGK
jgi:arylsulfatase A